MKVLVLATNYPNLDGGISLYYIHTRLKEYHKNGIECDVLNFSSNKNYVIDGINVISYENAVKGLEQYDIIISHAPNIRNHYRFIKKYNKKLKKIIYFFHGHEIVKVNEVYPKPFDYEEKNKLINLLRKYYDEIKLVLLKKLFLKFLDKSHFIFVSNLLYNEFLNNLKIKSKELVNKCYMIHNAVGKEFEIKNYKWNIEKKYDFITIRSNLDSSVYCIDIINQIAKNNPERKFLIVGKGKYFKFNKKSKNIDIIDKNLSHNEIIKLLNNSKCGLMPTRRDTQGLMACEMATFGIPLITSDIEICKEIFRGFKNIYFINNNNIKIDLGVYLKKIKKNEIKNEKFFQKETSFKEIKLIKSLCNY